MGNHVGNGSRQAETFKKSNEKLIDKLKTLRMDVNRSVISFVERTTNFQQDSKIDVTEPTNAHSLEKLTRFTSHYVSSECFDGLGSIQKMMQNMFNIWQTLRRNAMKCNLEVRRFFAAIPAKLCFFYFYTGELCTAVACLIDFVDLAESTTAMEAALRWLMFLGETELIEKKLTKWKVDETSEDMISATRYAISYMNQPDSRVEMLDKLIKLRNKIEKDDDKSSRRKFDLASYIFWLCSTLSNVPVGKSLNECDFPDRLSHIKNAVCKFESIIYVEAPGFLPYQSGTSVNASIWSILEENWRGNSLGYVSIGSTIAWYFELRREWAHVNVTTAQTSDSMSIMISNLRIALKSASFFRILQMTNTLAYNVNLIEDFDYEDIAKLMRGSLINLLSLNTAKDGNSTMKETVMQSEARTTDTGESYQSAPKTQNTNMIILDDQLEGPDMLNEKVFHDVVLSCTCNICVIYHSSSSFATEYMMSFMIYSNFSQLAIKHFNDEFALIRKRELLRESQIMMHGDSSIQPKPNIIQHEIFGMCVIRWLTKNLDSKECANETTMEVFKNALNIVAYLKYRTTDLFLTLRQLGRQLEFPMECNFSWIQPIIRKPRVKPTFEGAGSISRAVSPIGRRAKLVKKVTTEPFDSQRFENNRLTMQREMQYFAHILYREWRCRMYSYVGKTSKSSWEAAYGWAESTNIGSRNAQQEQLGKCKSGLVTIPGVHHFNSCGQNMPDDMTLIQIVMADDKTIYLVKLHADRDPIIMPLAHYHQAIEVMDKFTYLLEEDRQIVSNHEKYKFEECWDRRKIVDCQMKKCVENTQKHFLGAAASLLLPSGRLGPNATALAIKMYNMAKGGLLPGEAKELVYQSKFIHPKTWKSLVLRYCEMRGIDNKSKSQLLLLRKDGFNAMKQDQTIPASSKIYTHLVICPYLSQFCWERLPIFAKFPYVVRHISIHSAFSQLDDMRNQNKQIPLNIGLENAFYILDPDNNLNGTKRRMLKYINKFNWEGSVGSAPKLTEVTDALSKRDAFFYFGHGSGSSVVTQSLIRQTTCNAISFLMGCESVRTIPQAHGFDGTSVIQDYAMAKCPSLVGCLWDVQGGPKVW